MAPPAVPPIAGRYEIRDRIGAGAMGQVIEAHDRRVRRLVPKGNVPMHGAASASKRRLPPGCGWGAAVSAWCQPSWMLLTRSGLLCAAAPCRNEAFPLGNRDFAAVAQW